MRWCSGPTHHFAMPGRHPHKPAYVKFAGELESVSGRSCRVTLANLLLGQRLHVDLCQRPRVNPELVNVNRLRYVTERKRALLPTVSVSFDAGKLQSAVVA